MTGPEMDPPCESLADANDAAAEHDEREGEFRRELDADPEAVSVGVTAREPEFSHSIAEMKAARRAHNAAHPRASAVPMRTTLVLAHHGLTVAEATSEDDETLLGIPGIGPASLAYIRSTRVPQLANQSAFMRAIARFQHALNTRWGAR